MADDFAAVNRLNGAAQLPVPTAANCPNPYLTGQLPLPGEPIQVGTPGQPGGGGGGTTGPGGETTTGPAGSSAVAGTTTGSPTSGTSTQAAVAAAAAAASATAKALKAKGGTSANQVPGVALSVAAGKLLATPGPTGQIATWVLVLAGLFAVVPLSLAAYWRRRRRSGSPHAVDEVTG